MNRPLPNQAARRALREYHIETLSKVGSDRLLLLGLWPFVKPHKKWLATSIVTIFLGSAFTLMRPLIMMQAVDRAIASRDPQVMLYGGALLLLVTLLEQAVSFAQIYSVQMLGARSMADLRSAIFAFLGRLPLRFFDRQPVGRLVTRVTNDVDAILELFSSGALSALGDLVSLVGAVVLMLSLDAKLSLSAFIFVPFIGLFVALIRKRSREAFRAIRAETARMNANMSEQVSGISVIQAYGREAQKAAEFDEINVSYRNANMSSIKYDAVQDAAIDTVSAMSMASLIVALGYQPASFGTVVAISAYLTQFFMPISMLAQRYTLLQSALSGAERVFSLFQVEERDAPAGHTETRPLNPKEPQSTAEIEFSHVTFGYKPEQDVLLDVSLRAERGEVVALVGPTGSGKTTITSLLLRLYEPQTGTIRLRGQDIRSLPRGELRRNFAVVPQDIFLFEGTLADNIAAGQTPDLERVRAVLAQMDVLDVFLPRPGGLETRVDTGGINFSVGERQLIAFARALYRDADILILDEATASVDSATEARMQKALGALVRGRTALIVAHRLSTIQSASRIVVLQKGRVAESGTHAELVATGGLYAALHKLSTQATSLHGSGEANFGVLGGGETP